VFKQVNENSIADWAELNVDELVMIEFHLSSSYPIFILFTIQVTCKKRGNEELKTALLVNLGT
jgi:hypothetical protein